MFIVLSIQKRQDYKTHYLWVHRCVGACVPNVGNSLTIVIFKLLNILFRA